VDVGVWSDQCCDFDFIPANVSYEVTQNRKSRDYANPRLRDRPACTQQSGVPREQKHAAPRKHRILLERFVPKPYVITLHHPRQHAKDRLQHGFGQSSVADSVAFATPFAPTASVAIAATVIAVLRPITNTDIACLHAGACSTDSATKPYP
jgi:uncharacterized membrane protein